MTQRKLTPIAKAVEEIEKAIKEERRNHDFYYGLKAGLCDAKVILEKLKEYERECIEKSFDEGVNTVEFDNSQKVVNTVSELYFDTTYTQEGCQG